MDATRSFDYIFKIILIGDSGVGKSCLSNQYCRNTFSENFFPTIGVEFLRHTLEISGKYIGLEIWDSAGLDRYRAFTNSYYKGINGIILTYDISNKQSFVNLETWLDQIKDYSHKPRIMVGNKTDLEKERQVSYEEARAFSDKMNIKLIEASAKSALNVEDLFSTMVRLLILEREESVPVVINTSSDKEEDCDISIKIMFTGNSRVGKSCLAQQFCHQKFNPDYVSTIGVSFDSRLIEINNKKIKFMVWDPSGQGKFRNILGSYYLGVDVIAFIYDITDRQSFLDLVNWEKDVKAHNSFPDLIKFVIGNKCDLEQDRRVSIEEGKTFSDTLKAYFLEVSASDTDNIENSFCKSIKDIIESLDNDNPK